MTTLDGAGEPGHRPVALSWPLPLTRTAIERLHLLLYGVLLASLGMLIYALCLILAPFVHLITGHSAIYGFLGDVLWWSGAPVMAGALPAAIDLFILLPRKRVEHGVLLVAPANRFLPVVSTAFNDELSIGQAVADFLRHPRVRKVIVVDNNSQDATCEVAEQSGAHLVCEEKPGYGRCVYRALSEGLATQDTELTLL